MSSEALFLIVWAASMGAALLIAFCCAEANYREQHNNRLLESRRLVDAAEREDGE